MAAIIGLAPIVVAEACAQVERDNPGRVVVPANLNSPEQVVIAGHADAVQVATLRLKELGARRVLILEVSAPFHSPLMRPAQPRLAEIIHRIPFADAKIPVVTNVEARAEVRGERLRELLIAQVTAPVRWVEIVTQLAAEGCDTFIEFGPGSVLSALVRRQAPGARVVSISHPEKLEAACATLAA